MFCVIESAWHIYRIIRFFSLRIIIESCFEARISTEKRATGLGQTGCKGTRV